MGQEPTRPCSGAAEEHIGFWSFDLASGLSSMDPAVSLLFGIDAVDGARGVSCDRFISRIHPDDRAAAVRETDRVCQHHDLYSWYYQLEAADGTYQNMHAIGRCFEDAQGRPTHIAGILMRVEHSAPQPIELELVERLASVRELARLTPDPMLPRLIEAVMLHAGREFAKALKEGDHRG